VGPRNLAPGTCHTVDIVDVDLEGDGIALVEGRRVRVAGVLPGERVEIRAEHGHRVQPEVELLRLVSPSPARVVPRCRHAGVCGGCSWQHVAYPEQLRLKRQMLQRLLAESLGGGAPKVEPAIGVNGPGEEVAPWGFRDKIHFVFGPGSRGQVLAMGHYRRGSKAVVAVEECPVHAEVGNQLAFRVRDALVAARVPGVSADLSRGIARHLVVRAAHRRPGMLATLVVTANDRSLRGVVRRVLDGPYAPDGLHLSVHDRPGPYLFGKTTRNLHGRDRLREDVGGVSFLVSPTAFFQTNVRAAEVLVRLVLESVPEGPRRRVLDLYAGAGLFALPLARRGHQVIAVEESPEAVDDGLASQRFSRIPASACRFVRASVEDVLGAGHGGNLDGAQPDVVVLDPPRAGCGGWLSGALFGGLRPERVIYVSCNPEALARDLARAVAAAYRIDRVQPVDMFPHTAHIESVAVLTRTA
jgi:23S rRNA (uracil1939-C5)-methyltransferase